MRLVHRYKQNQPIIWFNKNKKKSNQYCLYCGTLVGVGSEVDSNKEHLIGRQFVPNGSFQEGSQFNFIFRACEKCNRSKSEIERHVSSISMFNAIQQFDKPAYINRAISKASADYHPTKKGVLVKDASDTHVFEFELGPLNMKFEVTSPPQLVQKYVRELSFYHIQGLFSLITSPNPLEVAGTSLLSEKYFWFHGAYNHHDWGNTELVEVAKRAKKLRCCGNINTADGNFKAVLFKTIKKPEYWFWALEWNKYLRVIGGISGYGEQPPIFDGLPEQSWKQLGKGNDGSGHRIRQEFPLSDEDILFTREVMKEED